MKIVYAGRNRKSGFTLVETLVTVSIIVILLAIGIAGILRYRNYLRITELDNMARSIYMAAQNRAVLLDNDRRFQTVLKGASGGAGGGTRIALTGSGKERWYIDSKTTAAAALDDLLPTGTIDPALRDGRFYIVYEAESASVTDVFYVEQDYDLSTYTGGIAGALGELGADDKRDKRMEHKPMIGWFGGNAGAPRGEYLEEPTVKVLITNKEELTLQVTFEMPAGVSDVYREPSVKLSYGTDTVDLLAGAGGGRLVKKDGADITDHSVQEATYTWVLDSLVPKSEDARRGRFKELFTGSPPLGGDFTVIAGLTLTASDGGTSSIYATGTDNSLFAGVNEVTVNAADGSSDTARSADIKYLRHLQNLDMPSSGVTPQITMAKQTQNIEAGKLLDNAGAEIKDSYEFTPIQNGYLSGCSAADQEAPAAGPCVIGNLKVTAASTGARSAAGLFSEAVGGAAANVFRFQNVRLVNPQIEGEDKNAGALVGSAENVSFENCQVTKASIKGSNAGGLAGSVKNAVFTDCLAGKDEGEKNDIDGKDNAGGMVGTADGSLAFAGCLVVNTEVKGTGDGSIAGGMAGSTKGVTFESHTAVDGIERKCTVEKITVDAKKYAGGMAGYNEESPASFKNCEAHSTQVTSTDGIAGGIAGGDKGDTAASFENCGIEELTVASTSNSAGGMLGCKSLGSVTFTGCTVGKDGAAPITITGGSNAGGLAGDSAGSLFNICTVYNASVSGTGSEGRVGGLAGNTAGECIFKGCQVSGTQVTGTGDGSIAGGMAGSTKGVTVEPHIAEDGSKRECTVEKITVDAKKYAGGMAGYNEGSPASFKNCEAHSTTVTSTDGIAGGIAGGDKGDSAASFENCGMEGLTVASTSNSAGGMLGCKSLGSATFTGCTVGKDGAAPITITGGSDAGGMLGAAEDAAAATFTDCTVGKADAAEKTVTVTTATGCAGGMAGNMAGGSFIGCLVVNTKVEGTGAGSTAGGMAGKTNGVTFGTNPEGIVRECSVENAAVEAVYIAGGMTGYNWGDQNGFKDCQVSNTAITCGDGWNFAGGISGFDESSAVSFEGCKVKGVNVSAPSAIAGGMMGCKNAGNVAFTDCTVGEDGTGTHITGGSHTGGMLGWVAAASGEALFTDCKVGDADEAITVVSSGFHAGGMLGCVEGTDYKASFTGCTVGKAGSAEVIVSGANYAGGLAGNSFGGRFENCTVINAEVASTGIGVDFSSRAGGLAGNTSAERFTNCIVGEGIGGKITVDARDYAGGMSGTSQVGPFERCQVINAGITSTGNRSMAGGLAGDTGAAEYNNCKVGVGGEVIVKAGRLAGGLAGNSWYNSNLVDKAPQFISCIAGQGGKISVEAGEDAGGLTGYTAAGQFTSCLVEGAEITGGIYTGGLAGYSEGWARSVDLTDCHVAGAMVTSMGNVAGGLLGYNWGSYLSFNHCGVEAITVKGEGNSAGGLLGSKGAGSVSFSGCAAGGEGAASITLTGGSYAGGLMGYTFSNCVTRFSGNCAVANAEIISKTGYAGGLAGQTEKDSVFSDCTAGGETNGKKITVSAKLHAGGLVGYSIVSSFENCKAVNATVTGGDHAGGLTGVSLDSLFKNCEAVNAAVTGVSSAGGIVGCPMNSTYQEKGTKTSITQCRVYWTHDLPGAGDYKVKVENDWGSAGGLIGDSRTCFATIQQSFAATFVCGGAYAGGLVGYVNAAQIRYDDLQMKDENLSSKVEIKNSYADCYLMTKADNSVGGLIGMNGQTTVLNNVYAAGFFAIDKGEGFGLCGGWPEVTVTNAYTAMCWEGSAKIYPLAKIVKSTNSGYLYNAEYTFYEDGQDVIKAAGTYYEQMTNLNLGDAFVKSPSETHPYNIDGTGRSGSYPFPGLRGLPHYGDWVTQAMASTADLMEEESLESDETATVSDNDMTVSDNDMADSGSDTTVSGSDAVPPDNGDTPAESGSDTTVSGSDAVPPGNGNAPAEGGSSAVPPDNSNTPGESGSSAVSPGNGNTPGESGNDTKTPRKKNDPDKPTDASEPPEGVVPPKNGEQMSGDETDDESGEGGPDPVSGGSDAASVSGNNIGGGGDTS